MSTEDVEHEGSIEMRARPRPVAAPDPTGPAVANGQAPGVPARPQAPAGRRTIWERVGRFDDAVDSRFEPWRGQASIDAAAKIIAGVSDHGYLWAAEAAWRARRRGPGRRRVISDLATAGFSSLLVNTAVKAAVGRARPDREMLTLGADRVPVREPTSSSFPSGHTLAAFSVATVSADRDRPWSSTARFGIAGLVGLSRVHLRAHHASDVLGGLVLGVTVGVLGRSLRRGLGRRGRGRL